MSNIKSWEKFSVYKVGDTVKIKNDLSSIIGTDYFDAKHPLYKIQEDNSKMNDFLGKEAKIVYVVDGSDKSNERFDNKFSRYMIDLDNGDYWWIDECFEKNL